MREDFEEIFEAYICRDKELVPYLAIAVNLLTETTSQVTIPGLTANYICEVD
jgi:hypothetical protein